MRVQLISDIHWDQNPHFLPKPLAGADCLVLAGDIASKHFHGGQFGLQFFSPKCSWPVPVFYVPGNHEYDHSDFDVTHQKLRDVCERLGITWLEKQVLVQEGIRWIGTTLWADFNALVAREDDAVIRRVKRRKAMRAANFYLPRMEIERRGQPFLARQVRSLALESKRWLTDVLAQPFNGTTVVVSHFAPSLKSADPRYGIVPGTAGFCNAWDELLPQVDYWLHGHLHCAIDYASEGCRVMANPVGYPTPAEAKAYRSGWLIDLKPKHKPSQSSI